MKRLRHWSRSLNTLLNSFLLLYSLHLPQWDEVTNQRLQTGSQSIEHIKGLKNRGSISNGPCLQRANKSENTRTIHE